MLVIEALVCPISRASKKRPLRERPEWMNRDGLGGPGLFVKIPGEVPPFAFRFVGLIRLNWLIGLI